ncbi:hypothetical protein [Micromonospora sp. RP3T]|uniref:hypothetical protein n=1 Tax=Micromonospora sp. RP3T TaxID=2135446 RepID=UPI000D15F7BC|nr:hypothetical protein [Micromonospora sp. RP3T]PTA46623.1 hypothetical protein C8054_09220 [Micromonospora sp. RP3T]
MPGVDVIVAALAAGATAGMTESASAAVRDAYAGLKATLRDRLRVRRPDQPDVLEVDETEAGVWKARLGPDLLDSGAAEDQEVVRAAQRLLALVAADRANSVDVTVASNYGAIGAFHAPVTFHQGPPVPPTPPAAP